MMCFIICNSFTTEKQVFFLERDRNKEEGGGFEVTNTKSTAFAGSFLNNRSPAATSQVLYLQSANQPYIIVPLQS